LHQLFQCNAASAALAVVVAGLAPQRSSLSLFLSAFLPPSPTRSDRNHLVLLLLVSFHVLLSVLLRTHCCCSLAVLLLLLLLLFHSVNSKVARTILEELVKTAFLSRSYLARAQPSAPHLAPSLSPSHSTALLEATSEQQQQQQQQQRQALQLQRVIYACLFICLPRSK